MTDQPTVEEKPKKKRTNSKAKGSGFESSISKILTDKLAPMKFRRSQSSGAILGGKNVKFMEQFSDEAKTLFIGDVCPSNESDVCRNLGWKFRFTLECKFYKTCDTIDHLFGNTKIKGWFEQALADSKKLGKEPLLIFKFNHTEIFCGVNADTVVKPTSATKIMTMRFPDGLAINIFLFKEALEDLEWWKIQQSSSSPSNEKSL